eukprot:gene44002-40642_t
MVAANASAVASTLLVLFDAAAPYRSPPRGEVLRVEALRPLFADAADHSRLCAGSGRCGAVFRLMPSGAGTGE